MGTAQMTATTITFRVDAAEHAEIAARAARDKISLSDYVRVRLGLRGEGPQDGADDGPIAHDGDAGSLSARLDDHDRRLDALEAGRAAAA